MNASQDSPARTALIVAPVRRGVDPMAPTTLGTMHPDPSAQPLYPTEKELTQVLDTAALAECKLKEPLPVSCAPRLTGPAKPVGELALQTSI